MTSVKTQDKRRAYATSAALYRRLGGRVDGRRTGRAGPAGETSCRIRRVPDTGFGLAVSVSGFVSTILAWRLSTSTIGEAALARIVAWLLCAAQVANIILSLRYFGVIQAAFSLGCAALLGWGAFRLGAQRPSPSGSKLMQ